MIAREERVWRLSEKGEGIKNYQLVIKNIHGVVKYNIVNIISTTVIVMCRARWVLEILGKPLCRVNDCLTTEQYT